MINCNEDENDSEKQIIQLIDLDKDKDTNVQNIAWLGKNMSICRKQDCSNI